MFVSDLFKMLSALSGISGSARFLCFQSFPFWAGSRGVFVFYRFKAFRSERDLWGCSFSIVIKISVLSGMSRGARFLSFSTLSVLSGISEGARFLSL